MGNGTSKSRSLEIILNGDVPSKKNSKRIITRGRRPYLISSANHEIWYSKAYYELITSGKKPATPIPWCKNIEILFYPSTKRQSDLTNKAESIMDLLVGAKFIGDDNWFICPDVHLKMVEVDKETPRTKIIINY